MVNAPDVGPRHLCRFIIRQIKTSDFVRKTSELCALKRPEVRAPPGQPAETALVPQKSADITPPLW
jgi:hypothetical protein